MTRAVPKPGFLHFFAAAPRAGLATIAAVYLAVTLVAHGKPAFQLFYTFQDDPRGPVAALVEGADGNFYGPARGGTWNRHAIFRITPHGVFSPVVSFDGTNGTDPNALCTGPDGNFYGSTYNGGNDYTGAPSSGKGTLFRLTPGGTLTTLVRFNGTNGWSPIDRLTLGSATNFYGTTFVGGSIYDGQYNFGFGTVFKLTPGGTLTTLFSFGATNGVGPRGVVEGKDGHLYGTTQGGGARDFGTIFRLTAGGNLTTLLSFNGTNGAFPRSLAPGRDGNFYGTTIYGGVGFSGSAYTGGGTVFQVTTNGVLTTLVAFALTNGRAPHAELVEAPDGSFYGTTEQGGTASFGTVFRVTTNGGLTTIASFLGANGAYPHYGLCRAGDGNLYGSVNGGGNGGGVIYRLVPAPLLTNLTRSDPSVSLTWTAFTNGIYRVESAQSLADTNWVALSPIVVATAGTAGLTNNATRSAAAFYRVVLLPGF